MAIWEEIMCKRCRQKVHISNVKCDINGELICIPCMEKLKAKKLEKKHSIKPKQRINYQCLRCRYHFSFGKDSRVALRCPYCDSRNIQKIVKESAQSLIRKAADDLYEF